MIINSNLEREFLVCEECGHPYFKVETQYLFPKDVEFRNGVPIPYKESITQIYCAKCKAPITRKKLVNINLVKK